MQYSLPTLAVNDEEFQSIQRCVLHVLLQCMHVASTIPTSIRHGPIEQGDKACMIHMGSVKTDTDHVVFPEKIMRMCTENETETLKILARYLAGMGYTF
jgi:hypothetical protein